MLRAALVLSPVTLAATETLVKLVNLDSTKLKLMLMLMTLDVKLVPKLILNAKLVLITPVMLAQPVHYVIRDTS